MKFEINEEQEKKYWLMLGIVFLILVCGQIVIPTLGDDKLFGTEPLSLAWLLNRYETWSSRIFIDGTSLFLARQMWLFRILNAAIFVILIDTFAKLTLGRKISTLFLLAVFFITLPITLFLSAGLVATSLNYLWPVTFAFYAISQIDKKLNVWTLVCLSVLMFYATNQEQVCIAVLLFLVGKIINNIYTHSKISYQLIIFSAITLVNLAIVAFCPGNSKRMKWSVKALFPKFSNYSIWDKMNLGVSNTSKYLLFQQNVFMIIFLFLLVLVLLFTTKRWSISLVSVIPFAIIIPVNVFLATLTGYGYSVATFSKYLSEKQSSPMLGKIMSLFSKLLNHEISLFWNVIFVILFIFILLSIYFIKNDVKLVFYYVVGLASHAMMGFSPTIFKSGDRTAFILYMVMIYIVLIMIKQISKHNKNLTDKTW